MTVKFPLKVFEPVVAKLPVLFSIESNLFIALDVNEFKLPVLVCNEPIIVFVVPVYVLNEDVER